MESESTPAVGFLESELLRGLTEAQKKAVTAAGGPTAVIAGPGSGKTAVLTLRAAYLCLAKGVSPENVVAVTFTTRAAYELRSRLASIPGFSGSLPFAGTFHALGLKLLPETGFQGEAQVLGEEALLSFVKEELGLPASQARKRLEEILRTKEAGKTPDEIQDGNPGLAEAYAEYEAAKRRAGLLDLPDLLLLPLLRIEEDPQLKRELSARRPYLLVDEFQDINPLQLRFLRALGGDGRGVFVIGDPNQAIYAFRGAVDFALRELQEFWPGLQTITLEENWRCTETILEAAKAVLPLEGRRTASKLRAVKGPGSPVQILEHQTPKSEAVWIVKTIEALIGGISFLSPCMKTSGAVEPLEGLDFGDIAVLYRTNAQGDLIEECFRKAGLPYRRIRAHKPETDSQVLSFVQEVRKKLPLTLPASQLRKKAPGANCGEALEALLDQAEKFPGTIQEFFSTLPFLRPEDSYVEGSHVKLMTMHAAKGLEFRVVFAAGLSDGIVPLPHKHCPGEEERLLYVAMTRAKERLFLSYFTRGRTGGYCATGSPSGLLERIPARCAVRIAGRRQKKKPQPKYRQLDLFS